jgi:hypothetical protein
MAFHHSLAKASFIIFVIFFLFFILWRTKLRLREAKSFAQGHTASNDFIPDWSPSPPAHYGAFPFI